MKSILASLLLVTSVSALAEADARPAPSHNRCDLVLKLSDSQKLEIKEISKASAEKMKALSAELKKASAAAEAVLAKAEASKEEALALADAVSAKMVEAAAVKKAEKIAVLFDVLTAEQRIKKVKCEKAVRANAHRRPQHVPSRPTYRRPQGPVIIVRPAPHRPHGPVYRPAPHRPTRPHHVPRLPHHPRGPRPQV